MEKTGHELPFHITPMSLVLPLTLVTVFWHSSRPERSRLVPALSIQMQDLKEYTGPCSFAELPKSFVVLSDCPAVVPEILHGPVVKVRTRPGPPPIHSIQEILRMSLWRDRKPSPEWVCSVPLCHLADSVEAGEPLPAHPLHRPECRAHKVRA